MRNAQNRGGSSLLSTEIQADIFYAYEEASVNDIYQHISTVESRYSLRLQNELSPGLSFQSKPTIT
jgi:hypothetical protein